MACAGAHQGAEAQQGAVDETATVSSATFAELVSSGLERSGLSLAAVRRRLAGQGNPVSMATLSYWRTGQRRPGPRSLEVVRGLEVELDLPPGHLVRAMTGTSRLVPLRPEL